MQGTRLFTVARQLVWVSLCAWKVAFWQVQKVKLAHTSMNFTPQASCPRSHKRGTICSRSSQLDGIQPPILLQRCWTKVGRTMVFWLWTRKKAKLIKSSMGKALTNIQEYHDMCAYQFELGYNLALFPCCNVSESPAFESVLGFYGGR